MVLLRSIVPVLSTLGLLLCLSSGAAARPGVEGEAPPRKPLQVFILAGQSNMQGHAELRTIDAMTLDPHTAELLPLMRDAAGEPRVCERVWINSLGSAPEVRTGPLTVGFGAQGRQPKFGPEFTFGLYAEKLLDAPILIIKTAWGGKSLHTDFRPPSAGPFILGERARAELEKKGADVEAAQAERTRASGVYYRAMMEHIREVLSEIETAVPGYDRTLGHELAGFVWFQGWNDMVASDVYPQRDRAGGYDLYSDLLTTFIRDVRRDLSSPKLPFVIGVLGVGGPLEQYPPDSQRYKGVHGNFRRAMAAPASLREFRGTVLAVETAPFWDQRVAALREREKKLRPRFDQLKKEVEAGTRTPAEAKAERERIFEETFNEEERVLLLESVSNGDYHYMGSARVIAPIGRAFAEAAATLVRRSR